MNREMNEYKTENDLIMQLAREAIKINMKLSPGTQFSFYKTNEGKIRPIGKETPADVTKIPIFSEIVRSGTRGKYQYTVSINIA